jgi:SpoVK/Ycf46/Vps4 family AAA+-type ATPase
VNAPGIFDSETVLPDESLTAKERTLLGFEARYVRVRGQLRLLLSMGELSAWNERHHRGRLALVELVAEQYPLAVFHGDVGTGKTATAECVANRLVAEARAEDSVLFKLSNRVRGSGKVGEMGTLLAEAFLKVAQTAGRSRRAILLIDEGDSLAAARTQEHSHHEDKVAVNTLIQNIDDLRRFGGRVVVVLCTNRMTVLDPALQRRAAIIEEFLRPTPEERRELFTMDLGALPLTEAQLSQLVALTGAQDGQPAWTYSDIRTRLYPAALAMAFPERPLKFDHLQAVASTLKATPIVKNY